MYIHFRNNIGEEASRGQILTQIEGFLGREPALQIQEIIQNANNHSTVFFTRVVGFIVLLFSASGVFAEIQSGLNQIWSVKTNPNIGWLKKFKSRFVPFIIVLGVAFFITGFLGLKFLFSAYK